MLKFDENNKVITEEQPSAILVGLQLRDSIEKSMDELKGLAEADNCIVLGQVIQTLEKPNNATFIGKGKVEELREMVDNMEADMVIFNDELSGIQLRNLEEALGCQILDRTSLILDIFATRALSKEGRLQVELAQLRYRMPRLIGLGKNLSRQGGGIGNRGPGEKKLETDRRHIEKRLDEIRRQLKELKSTRSLHQERRNKSGLPIVALVGYTNVGKSAIMNRLISTYSSGEEHEEKLVTEKDMLFATLDTFARKVELDKNKSFILIDTVGFVSKLPHSLVEAFKSTLEQLHYADLILHVVDASNSETQFQIDVTNSVMEELKVMDKDKLLIHNKIDKVGMEPSKQGENIYISAKHNMGMDILVSAIEKKLFGDRLTVEFLFPYENGREMSAVCEKAKVESIEYAEAGTVVIAEVELALAEKYSSFIKSR